MPTWPPPGSSGSSEVLSDTGASHVLSQLRGPPWLDHRAVDGQARLGVTPAGGRTESAWRQGKLLRNLEYRRQLRSQLQKGCTPASGIAPRQAVGPASAFARAVSW